MVEVITACFHADGTHPVGKRTCDGVSEGGWSDVWSRQKGRKLVHSEASAQASWNNRWAILHAIRG